MKIYHLLVVAGCLVFVNSVFAGSAERYYIHPTAQCRKLAFHNQSEQPITIALEPAPNQANCLLTKDSNGDDCISGNFTFINNLGIGDKLTTGMYFKNSGNVTTKNAYFNVLVTEKGSQGKDDKLLCVLNLHYKDAPREHSRHCSDFGCDYRVDAYEARCYDNVQLKYNDEGRCTLSHDSHTLTIQ